MGDDSPANKKAKEDRRHEASIMGAKRGDWDAKANLVRTYLPLLTSLAQKRSTNTAELNAMIEAGKHGLMAAAKKYKPSTGPDGFQLFALDFIEASMDRADGTGGGLFSKLFRK